MIPDWAWWWFISLVLTFASFGALIGLIFLGWLTNHRVEMLDRKRDNEVERFKLLLAHEAKLLDLKAEQQATLLRELGVIDTAEKQA